MDLTTQFMYWVGTLIMLIVSVAAFGQGLNALREWEQEQDELDWREQWKQSIKTMSQ